MKSLSASNAPVNLVDFGVGIKADALKLEPRDGRFIEFPRPPLDPRPLPPDEVCCEEILGTQSDDYVVEETFPQR